MFRARRKEMCPGRSKEGDVGPGGELKEREKARVKRDVSREK